MGTFCCITSLTEEDPPTSKNRKRLLQLAPSYLGVDCCSPYQWGCLHVPWPAKGAEAAGLDGYPIRCHLFF